LDYTKLLSHYLEGLSDDCDLVSEAIASLESSFEDMSRDKLLNFNRTSAIAYLALKQIAQENRANHSKSSTTIYRNWCKNVDEIAYYLEGQHEFPGVNDDLQEKWGCLESADDIISISWDAKNGEYLVICRQRLNR
jgi:hypothetical protein